MNVTPSPAAETTKFGVSEATRIPLSGGRMKLQVPKIPGYHLYWFLDKPGRVEAALAAGYEFVQKDEVQVPNHQIAAPRTKTDGTDLGSRVTVVAGGEEGGQAQRHVLMKLRQEWRDKDMKAREAKSDALVAALTRGNAQGPDKMPGDADTSNRYLGRHGQPNPRTIFTKRT